MPVYALDLARVNAKLAGLNLSNGYEADSEFTVVSEAHHMPRPIDPDCVAPFGECTCNECTRCNLQYGLGMFDGGEMVRVDVCDAVIDAVVLHLNPPTLVDVWDDWNALGMSDPVHLAPLELRF